MDLLTYNVEVSNKDFSKVAILLDHVKIIRTKGDKTVIETDRYERTNLTRHGISYVIVTKGD